MSLNLDLPYMFSQSYSDDAHTPHKHAAVIDSYHAYPFQWILSWIVEKVGRSDGEEKEANPINFHWLIWQIFLASNF